jgi:hypothetical protein
MMFHDALPIVLALLLQAAAQQRPAEQTLDVMGIPPPTVEMEQEFSKQKEFCGCATGTSPQAPQDPRLKVALVYVTPETFTVGDKVIFELLIDHVGDAPIPLAISRNPTLAPSCRNANGDVRTNFALFTKGSHEPIAVGPGLYGERGTAATTMMLNPGERLRVRVPATISGMDRTRTPSGESQALEVEGAILASWDGCRSIVERSQGAVPVIVSRPK